MSNTLLRILAVPKSSSTSLATSSASNRFLRRLIDTIPRVPKITDTIVTLFLTLPNPFELPLQILVLFQFFLSFSEILVLKGHAAHAISIMRHYPSLLSISSLREHPVFSALVSPPEKNRRYFSEEEKRRPEIRLRFAG